jgi:predicted PurR-regulated permease PerM
MGTRPDEHNFLNWVPVRTSLLGILIVMIFAVLYFAAPLLKPIAFALLLYMVFAPVERALERFLPVPAPLRAALILLSFMALLAASFYFLSKPAQDWVENAPQHLQKIERKLAIIKKPVEKAKQAAHNIESSTSGGGTTGHAVSVQSTPPGQNGFIMSVVSGTSGAAAKIGSALVLLYFLLIGERAALRKMVELTPRLHEKRRVVELVDSIEDEISSYLATITLINFCLGCVDALALWLLGMPNPLLWGGMVFVFNYMPYVGALADIVILTIVALLSFSSFLHIALVPAVVLLIGILEGQFITPMVVGHRLALSPVAIFIALMTFSWLWGIPGLIVAVPILASVKIICDRIDPLEPIGIMLGEYEEKAPAAEETPKEASPVAKA